MAGTRRSGGGIIAMIPARAGSERLPEKNLALLRGKPVIAYAIETANEADVFERVVVNSEDPRFGVIASRYGAEFYRRPAGLATSAATSDEVVYDFLRHHPCDIVAWVNPISPLQKGEEVRDVVRYFVEKHLDSLVTVRDEQVHCVYKGRPINFTRRGRFSRTQDLMPVQVFIYSVMMWRTATFIRHFERHGYALLCGRVGYYPVGRLSAIIIKRQEDLALAEALIPLRGRLGKVSVRYHSLAGAAKRVSG